MITLIDVDRDLWRNQLREGDMQILAIDRPDEFVSHPDSEVRLGEGARLLVYGRTKSIEHLSA